MSTITSDLIIDETESPKHLGRYVAVGLGVLLSLALLPGNVTIYVLASVAAALLVLGVRRPALIVVAILLVELTISDFPPRLPGLPMNTRYVVTFFGLAMIFVLYPIMKWRMSFGPGAKRVVIPGVLFVFLVYVATSNGFTSDLTFQAMRFYVAALIIMILIPTLIRNVDDFRLVGTIVLIVIVISSASAIMQHFSSFGIPAPKIWRDGLFNGRSIGLSSSHISISNHAMVGILLLWGIVTQLKLERMHGRLILVLTAIVGIGLYFTYTRSALAAVVLGAAFMTIFLSARIKKELIFALFLLAPILVFMLVKENTRYTRDLSGDSSSAARSILWKTGLAIAKDYPYLGIGYDAFNVVAPDYADLVEVDENVSRLRVDKAAIKSQIHNDFLRVWVSFGALTLIPYILLLLGIAVNSLQAYFREKDPWLRGTSIGCFGAIIAYVVNSIAHNSLDSGMILWVLAGLSLVLLRLSSESRNDPSHSVGLELSEQTPT